MNRTTISRLKTHLFSDLSNQLVYNQDRFLDFINTPYSKDAFQLQAQKKQKEFSIEKRNTLVESLEKQYSKIETSSKVKANISALKNEQTFTVTTGHQLSLFTGPLYFIYKILNTIKLANELNAANSDFKYVPVFWIASEDHDFEEVQSINVFNKNFKWDTTQKGAVGRFKLENFDELKEEFKLLFANHTESEVLKILDSYQGETYGEATFKLVNELFKDYGLVIIDGDAKSLKNSFKTVVKHELENQFSFNAVEHTNLKIDEKGFKRQLNAREINLFYLDHQLRNRIIKNGNLYTVENVGDFTFAEIIAILEESPEKFSPNVVLRPLFQEFVLPNICYLGGGGEIAYWLQLKGVFSASNIEYPLINVRNSLLIIDSNTSKKINKIGFYLDGIFDDINKLKKDFILKNTSGELDFSELSKLLLEFTNELKRKVIGVNEGLSNFAEAEITKMNNQFSSIQQKLIKTEKEKYENSLKQIDQIKEKLFPNDKPQERVSNFFSLCSDGNVYTHLAAIYDAIDPFEKDLILLTQ